MGCGITNNSLLGSSSYIKFKDTTLVAIEGPNTIQTQILGDIRFPYKQVMHGKIVLKAGQTDYLLNHLGLGDNVTFLSLVVRYDKNSKIEEDNYITYSFYGDTTIKRSIGQMMLLTGNSTNRVPQLYLSNPNETKSVTIDVMVAVIDDEYSFFSEFNPHVATALTDRKVSDIETYRIDKSLVIYNEDTPRSPLGYINLDDISSMTRYNRILIVDKTTTGKTYLDFIDEYNAIQALSLISYAKNNQGSIIEKDRIISGTISGSVTIPRLDDLAPVIYFDSRVHLTSNPNSYVEPFSSTYSNSFYATYSVTDFVNFGTSPSSITTYDLASIIVSSISDERDGLIGLTSSMINVTKLGTTVSMVESVGTYSVSFTIKDLANNAVNTSLIVDVGVI
jgi:hypothetical protein